jgi:hypothetical protein
MSAAVGDSCCTIFMLPQVGFICVVTFFTIETLVPGSGCVINYPVFVPWYWFGSIAPTNVLFSSVFSYVAYKQDQLFGSDAWMRLAKDGIQTMCLVIACNVTCKVMLPLEVGGESSEFSFIVDW